MFKTKRWLFILLSASLAVVVLIASLLFFFARSMNTQQVIAIGDGVSIAGFNLPTGFKGQVDMSDAPNFSPMAQPISKTFAITLNGNTLPIFSR